MKRIYQFCTILLILSVFLFSGCEEPEIGIFYSLEIEEKIIDAQLPNDLVVSGFAELDNQYYIAAYSFYKKDDTADTWQQETNLPEGYSGGIIDTAVFNSSVYALATTADGSAQALFTYDASDGTWSEVTVNSEVSMYGELFTVNGSLCINGVTSNSETGQYQYTLYASSDASTFTQTAIVNSPQPANAGAFDSTNYWITAGNRLFSGADFTALAAVTDISSDSFNDVLYSSEYSAVFVTTAEGIVLAYRDNEWIESGKLVDSTDDPVMLTALAEYTEGEVDYLLIGSGADGHGSSSQGYFQIALSEISEWTSLPTPATPKLNSYIVSDLRYAAVIDFHVDTENVADGVATSVLYACTTEGLWVNTPQEDGTRLWSWE